MKKVIKEQDYSKLNGKVANLYSDPENKQFTGQLKIDSVSPTKGSSDKGNWLGNAILDIEGMIKDPISKNVRRKLTFVCGTLPFPDTKNLKPGLYIGPKQIFSINLENELKKFCTVSKGGAAVPKADFVSADVTVDEPMTEGKRVIRLTESDLVRLVKKVVSERFEIMGELLSRAEEFLKENGIDSSNMDENEIYENVNMLTQDENKRIRHSANKLKAEMIGFFGRQS